MFVDRSFRDLVLRKIHNDVRHRVAPSYGFDLVAVVRHAWRAWFIDLALGVGVLGSLAVAVITGHLLAVVLVLAAMGFVVLGRIAVGILADVARLQTQAMGDKWLQQRIRRTGIETASSLLGKRRRLLEVVAIAMLLTLLTPPVLGLVLQVSLFEAVHAAVVVAALVLGCGAAFGVARQVMLNSMRRADSLRPLSLTRRESVIAEQQEDTCVVYQRPSGEEDEDDIFPLVDPEVPSPFVGAGKLVNRWLPPMTIQLARQGTEELARREFKTPPFKAHDLVERLRSALAQLGQDPGKENLPGLQVRDRIYVAEPDVAAIHEFLVDGVRRAQLHDIIDNHQNVAHHFLETMVPIVGGEIVATVLIRVSVKGRCLSLDVATTALTRTPAAYGSAVAFGSSGVGAVLTAAVRSMVTVPMEMLRLWRLADLPVFVIKAWRARRTRSRASRQWVTAPALALRAEKADAWKNAQLDETMISDHMKIVEQRIIKTTEDFLESYGIDTSAFEKQATNIINSGVLNMGGELKVTGSAVGDNARIAQMQLASNANGSES